MIDFNEFTIEANDDSPHTRIHHSDHNQLDTLRFMRLLKRKFETQQFGKKKWLEHRETQLITPIRDWHFFPIEFMNDKLFILEYVKKHGQGIYYASRELKNDRTFLLEVLPYSDEEVLHCANCKVFDREFLLEAVKHSGHALEFATHELKKDKQFVMEAVSRHGAALQYASKELKNDRDVVLRAVQQNAEALKFTHEKYYSDYEIILEAVKKDAKTLFYASSELKCNREIVMEAVRKNGRALVMASKQFLSDKEIILEALKTYSEIFHDIPQELKNDMNFVLQASQYSISALKYLPKEYKSNREFILQIVKQNGSALAWTDEELKYHDREIVLEAVRNDGRAIYFVPKEGTFYNDKEITLQAIQHGCTLELVSPKFHSDRDVLLTAARRDANSLSFISTQTSLMENNFELYQEVALECVKKDADVFQYISPTLRNNKEFILTAIRQNYLVIRNFTSQDFTEFQKDLNFVLGIIQITPAAMRWLSEDLKRDKEFILKAVRRHGQALKFATLRSISQEEKWELIIEAVKQNGYVSEYTDELYLIRMYHCYGEECDNLLLIDLSHRTIQH